ncbi:bestrophin-4-like [Culicoides brevitarsis]|uniref:bestrophin-4-like n=1 Tax=Culicoides brevitarsis TaxID=469753 RepID=UPI00307BC67A
MTVPYTREVPNGSSFGVFWKILWIWRGSVYKMIWRELIFYLTIYYAIHWLYIYKFDEEQKASFDDLRDYIKDNNGSIPLSFVLGFYVTLVVNRWWSQFRLLPWPDTLALFISAAIPGNDEVGRLMRRNVVRYMMLSYVITLRMISLRVKKRFPDWQHLVDAGFMHESEKKIFELMDLRHPMSKYWMPLVWATNIINRARKEELIKSDQLVQTLLTELSDIRVRLSGLHGFDFVCVPLVYTQVVTLALYSYFGCALLGTPKGYDFYFPIFTVLQFCFYVGWLKVAEVLINPWGEDDDDIELNWFIDRHIKAAYMIVDEMHEEHPELLKDQFWEEVVPRNLPYTIASQASRRFQPRGSAEDYKVKDNEALYANINIGNKNKIKEDIYGDYELVKKKNWFSRQLNRMGSTRSFRSFYSRGSGSEAYQKHQPDTRISMPNPAKYSPAKSSIYERIMRRPRSPDKNSQISDISTFERKPAKLPPPGYDNPLIGRLVLTPVNELSLPTTPALNRLQLPGNTNSLVLVSRQNSSPTTLVYQAATEKSPPLMKDSQTNTGIVTSSVRSEASSSSSTASSATHGSANINNDEDDDDGKEKREVFV